MDILTFIYHHAFAILQRLFTLDVCLRRRSKKSSSWNPASLSCEVLANGVLTSSLCVQKEMFPSHAPHKPHSQVEPRYPPSFFPQQHKKNKLRALLPMKAAGCGRMGSRPSRESAVFLAANQSPVLWRVAYKKQSGKRGTRYFPVCRGGECRGKSTRGTRDCSETTDEHLNTTVWPNKPSGPPYIYGHTSTHVWREDDLGQNLSLCVIWGCQRHAWFWVFCTLQQKCWQFCGYLFSLHK